MTSAAATAASNDGDNKENTTAASEAAEERQSLKSTKSNSPEAEEVGLKKELGLLEGVSIIVGIIIGSGIFVSPKGVLQEAGSVGVSLIVWVVCGMLSMLGALCYAELGTSIPESGSDYAYIGKAFGGFPSFLYLWDANFIFVPTTNAVMALTVSNYMIQPFFGEEDLPKSASTLLAAVFICGLTWLNCYSMKVTTRLQNVFMVTKVVALLLVICVGIYALSQGGYKNFDNAFAYSETEPGKICLAFYSGIYSYAGWNYLNFMTEELKDPFRNLPYAIYLSLPVVTFLYILANVAYLAVLTPTEMMASNAIAVTFANNAVATWAGPIMTILVAISALGSLSAHIMTSSRLCFVGARKGHIPTCLSLVSVKHSTPEPALIFLGVLSCLYLFVGDIYVLINYASFVESSFILISIASLLFLRWKQPDLPRPIKITIVIPIAFFVICSFLVLLPFYVEPLVIGNGLLVTALGIPVYLVGVYWQNKPPIFHKIMGFLNINTQKMFMAVKEE